MYANMVIFYDFLQVLTYIVEVHTGSEPGSDSEVKVHAQIFGTRGDTGVRQLLKPIEESEDPMFSPGKVHIK